MGAVRCRADSQGWSCSAATQPHMRYAGAPVSTTALLRSRAPQLRFVGLLRRTDPQPRAPAAQPPQPCSRADAHALGGCACLDRSGARAAGGSVFREARIHLGEFETGGLDAERDE